jgi:Ni,Fe-hydrogenase III large subunit
MVVEELCGISAAAIPIRAIALELERVAMHLADLSALAGDVAFIMGQNLFAALRTTIINSSLAICGSRFGKRWLCPGGVNYGISASQCEVLMATLQKLAGRSTIRTAMYPTPVCFPALTTPAK